MVNIFVIVFYLVVIAGFIALQIFLSKRANKWLGLILPAISLLFSILMFIGIIGFSAVITESEVNVIKNGEVIEQTETLSESSGDITSIILQGFMVFLLSNIPTAILVGIYFACRQRMRKEKQIEKMNIQDLE